MFEQPKHFFVFMLFFCMTALVHPLPFNTTVLDKSDGHSISRRWRYSSSSSNDVLLGFRYVDEWKAHDYNQHETLTAIPASANMIGEGAYLSPVLDQYEKYKGYWECTVAGNSKSIKAASKLFIPIDAVKVYVPAAIREYALKKRKDVTATILFSKLMYYYSPVYQMLIPPKYLVTSSNSTTSASLKGGANTLGLKVWCVQPGCTGRTPVAKWSNWKIPQSPVNDPDWMHPHQITRKAGSQPSCDKSPPKPDWVAQLFR
ncbi:hypothetical protein EV360DRAFT_69400 [Lentinula raphanica]|nr:hypothetical protein EV360DRAFT_69400 [Lentinula raphanica]